MNNSPQQTSYGSLSKVDAKSNSERPQNKEMTKKILRKCDEVSRTLKSLSSPTRLKILCHILNKECGVNELAELCETSQPAMSQILKRLSTEGILHSRRDHNFIYYKIVDQKLIRLLKAIRDVYC